MKPSKPLSFLFGVCLLGILMSPAADKPVMVEFSYELRTR